MSRRTSNAVQPMNMRWIFRDNAHMYRRVKRDRSRHQSLGMIQSGDTHVYECEYCRSWMFERFWKNRAEVPIINSLRRPCLRAQAGIFVERRWTRPPRKS